VNIDSGVVNRIKTGVKGLDNMVGGGIPEGSQILFLGSPGAGKTLLSLEILYHNAKLEIPSTFITNEERKGALVNNIKNAFYSFDDYEDYISSNMIQISHRPLIDAFKSRENFEKFISDCVSDIQTNKSKLVIFDSISSLRPIMEDDRTFTRAITYMTEALRDIGVTSILTYEVNQNVSNSDPLSIGLYSTSMFDGIMVLSMNRSEGATQYSIEVTKLRNSAHKLSSLPYQITDSGFDVLSN